MIPREIQMVTVNINGLIRQLGESYPNNNEDINTENWKNVIQSIKELRKHLTELNKHN